MNFIKILPVGIFFLSINIAYGNIPLTKNKIANVEDIMESQNTIKEFKNWISKDISMDIIWRSYLYAYKENTNYLLNPDNKLFNVPQPLNKNQLEIFLDAPLNNELKFKFWDVDSTFASPFKNNNLVLENYLSYEKNNMGLRTGKIRVNWATSLSRNPFDLFRQFPQIPFDPDNAPQLQEGINMAIIDVKNRAHSFTFLYGDCPSNSCNIKGNQFATRVTLQKDNTEWIGIIDKKIGRNFSIGLGFNALVQNNLVLRMENLISNFRDRGYAYLAFDNPELYAFTKPSNQITNELLLGTDITFSGTQLLQLEYYFNSNGYTKNESRTLRKAIKSSGINNPFFFNTFLYNQNPYQGFLYQAANISLNSVLRRNYINMRYSTNQKFSTGQFDAYTILSLDDHSQIYYLDYKFYVNEFITIIPSFTLFNGGKTSQYGLVPDKYIANVLIRFDF